MKRFIYQKLIEWKKSPRRKPLIVKGARQVGKTYLLELFGKEHFPRYHYLNFEKNNSLKSVFEESISPDIILQKLSFVLKRVIDPKTDLLIFDEIQVCPRALTSLKYFQEDMPEMALCAAGSLLGVYLGPVSYPVGKVDHLHMYPMSFEEFLLATDDNTEAIKAFQAIEPGEKISEIIHSHFWERLKWYFVVGGLPEVVSVFKESQHDLYAAFTKARIIQNQLIESYLADMAKHSGKQNALHLSRVWQAVPEQLVATQDGSMSKFKFRGVLPGVSHYSRIAGVLDWLEGAGLIIKVPVALSAQVPLSAFTKENTFKLFLFDTGILGALSSLDPGAIIEYAYGTYKGYVAENFVAQELLQAGISKLYSWHEKTAEVEFLCTYKNQVVPIEVKSGNSTRAKSLSVFATKYDPPFQLILSGKSNFDLLKKGRNYWPLYMTSRIDSYLSK